MQNKNVDGLNKSNIKKISGPGVKVNVKIDSIISRPQVARQNFPAALYNKPSRIAKPKRRFFANFGLVKKLYPDPLLKLGKKFRHNFRTSANFLNFSTLLPKWRGVYTQKRVPVLVAVVALFFAFGAGVLATLNTGKIQADQPQVLGAFTDTPALTVQPSGPLGQIGSLPNNVMFNMTISQLEDYFNQVAEASRQNQQAQTLAQRETLLKAYLQEKNSPLAEIAGTLAGLKHWQMVLAISNSESSLGRRCAGPSNNCSGIGGAPGQASWRTYATKAEWAKDLDRLLEKRYKNWTLDQMNGVYNKPGSPNWPVAAKQILEDLQQRNIQ